MESLSSESTQLSEPLIPPDSPGSSVSSRFQEEYDELLKYAIVVPASNSKQQVLVNGHPSGAQEANGDDDNDAGDGTIVEEEEAESVHPSEERLSPDPKDASRSPLSQSHRAFSQGLHGTGKDNITTKLFPEDQMKNTSDATHTRVTSKEVTLTLDQDLSRMEDLLDTWTADLKRNVLGEFGQSKIRVLEQHRQSLIKERERFAGENAQLQEEVERLKELLHTYEQSIGRKDQVIANLTQGLQKQREKQELTRAFCEWKIQRSERQREAFAANLAQRHRNRHLVARCWAGWHSIIENKWRQRVEKACQAKAEEVCLKLTDDYESQIKSLNEALESSREEVSRLHAERERYEEAMKKAFMRGVCALNMEAMNMFHEGSDSARSQVSSTMGEQPTELESVLAPTSLPSQPEAPPVSSEPPGGPLPRVITSQAAARGPTPGQGIMTQAKIGSKSAGRGKCITAKVTARVDTGRGPKTRADPVGPVTLAPPMTSVVVERHHSVTKQTIGQATASKFPSTQKSSLHSQQPPLVQPQRGTGPIAGQVPITTSNVHTVKVVD